MANLRFVYRKSSLKLGTNAVRILLENASFRQVQKPVRTSNFDVSSFEMEKSDEASTWISSRSRYDHFDTSPYCSLYSITKKPCSVNRFFGAAGAETARLQGLSAAGSLHTKPTGTAHAEPVGCSALVQECGAVTLRLRRKPAGL